MKYALVTVSEHGEHIEQIFNSDIQDLELNPYSDDCPIVVGSNQIIRLVENMPKPKIDKSLRPDFDYDCECGFYVCTECGYPYYPMEVMKHDNGSNEICYVCDFGDIVKYCLAIKV